MIDFEPRMQQYRQEVREGYEAGYIGDVELVERPVGGWSNLEMDPTEAEQYLAKLKRQVATLEAQLDRGKSAAAPVKAKRGA